VQRMPVVLKKVRRPAIAGATAERWRLVPAAIIADMSGGACQIDQAIRPLNPPGRQPRLFGRAVTALCQPPDFGAVLHAIDQMQRGDVLVIAAGGNGATAMIGEILGGQVQRAGGTGIVCDGAIRDVGELSAMTGLAVFTRHITPRGPSAWEKGVVNGEVSFGGRMISAGDLVIGDDDGLVSLTPEEAENLIAAAEEKLGLEAQWQASLGGGQSIAQTFGLPPISPAD
jgi:4-hydroxy-4-methyl-2-oxoglutarate aldolase